MASRDSAPSDITPEVLLRAYACGIFPMAESVDDPTLFARAFERPVATLRPLRYEAVASDPGAGVFGCGAHSDYGEGFWECVFCLRILLLGHSSRFCPFTPLRPPKTQTKAC